MRSWLPEEVIGQDGQLQEEEELFEFYPEEEGAEEGQDGEKAKDHAASEKGEDEETALFRELKGLGLDTEAALSYCFEDRAFYKELLNDFVLNYPVKMKELDAYFAAKDWHEFEIRIHALKSMTKTIGAAELSGRALELEKAAEEMDAERIGKAYPVFAAEYSNLTDNIGDVLKMTEEADGRLGYHS